MIKLLSAAILLAAATVGCGASKPKLVVVTGRVLQQGRPVTAGSIWFHPDPSDAVRSEKSSCLLQLDGSFVMRTYPWGDGVPPGKYKVTLLPDLANRLGRPELGNPDKTTLSIEVPESGLRDHTFEIPRSSSRTAMIANRTPEAAKAVIKFHASLNVSDLAKSLEFYSALFGCEPVKSYPDYAKFEIDVPPLILSLKPKRACAGGPLNHLGLRLPKVEDLHAIHERLKAAGARIGQQDDVKCCYALQSKLWVTDPDETLWEIYVLHDDVPNWGEKDKKVKLLAAPLKAFGIRGVIRRAWANRYGRRPEPMAPERLAQQQGAEPTPTVPADTCTVPLS